MYPAKRLPSIRCVRIVGATALVLGIATLAFGADGSSAHAMHHIRNRTVFSEESPRVKLIVRRGFRFIGSQEVTLYGSAEAEQYLFVKPGPEKIVERFYWIQFEHFLPTNNRTYNYDSTRTTRIGDLQFIYNVGSWPDYASAVAEDPASDGAAIERLLGKQHLSFPQRAVHVRMFHLPSADHRSELMIIYGEALPHNAAVPVRNGGVALDRESPTSAQTFLEHAHQGLIVESR